MYGLRLNVSWFEITLSTTYIYLIWIDRKGILFKVVKSVSKGELILVDWSRRQRLQREQRELKAPQERSDEEIEAVPADRVCLEWKSTASHRKMRVWERNSSHTRIDFPKMAFSVPLN